MAACLPVCPPLLQAHCQLTMQGQALAPAAAVSAEPCTLTPNPRLCLQSELTNGRVYKPRGNHLACCHPHRENDKAGKRQGAMQPRPLLSQPFEAGRQAALQGRRWPPGRRLSAQQCMPALLCRVCCCSRLPNCHNAMLAVFLQQLVTCRQIAAIVGNSSSCSAGCRVQTWAPVRSAVQPEASHQKDRPRMECQQRHKGDHVQEEGKAGGWSRFGRLRLQQRWEAAAVCLNLYDL